MEVLSIIFGGYVLLAPPNPYPVPSGPAFGRIWIQGGGGMGWRYSP